MSYINGQTCDICGIEEFHLNELTQMYQTEDIKRICTSCNIETSNHLRKLNDITFPMNQHWLKKWMINMKKRLALKKKK